ncbi:MAG TPA: hypothetical protein VGJ17_07435, partial [Candidatus Limnocylindrales bacterium]
DARIAARKEQLVTETDDQARSTEATLASLAEAVGSYEAEAGEFFDRLLAEEDPARLAGLAERMPAPPALDAFGAATATDAEPAPKRSPAHRNEPAEGSVEAEAGTGDEPIAQAPVADAPIADARVAGAPVAEAPVTDPADAAKDASAGTDPATAGPTPDGLDAESAAAAEAAALAGLDDQTQLIVSGLSDVGAIATFKAALMHDTGVSAVSVNAGNDGDYLFTVTHSGETDVRVALRDMDAFQTRLIADDGSTLVVVAHQLAA